MASAYNLGLLFLHWNTSSFGPPFFAGFLGAAIATVGRPAARLRYLRFALFLTGLIWLLTPLIAAVGIVQYLGLWVLVLAVPIGCLYAVPGFICLSGGLGTVRAS
jgi:hypothetical protein